jgi:hypothetical protein
VANLEVDPAALEGTARILRRCVDMAGEVAHHRGRLTELAQDCGSDRLREAAEHFIGRWGYGMGHVELDAGNLADRLEHSAAEYRRLETTISRALRE